MQPPNGKRIVCGMYSVLHFGLMAADEARTHAYERALAQHVKPGDVVLDLGAGTGILSLLAARAGASRVHACDPSPPIWLLPEIAKANGLADRIVIHPQSSWDLELPARVNVIVADLRGALPLIGDHFAVQRDAKKRFLAPGGMILPVRDDFHVALVESDELATMLARGTSAFEGRGWSAEAARTSIVNTTYRDNGKVDRSDILAEADRPWGHVFYGEPDGAVLEGEVELSVRRPGRALGLLVWFDATVAPGCGFTTAPGTHGAYSRILLPLAKPTRIEASDRVTAIIRVDPSGDRWAWDTVIHHANGTSTRFRQTTFFGMPGSPDAFLRASSTYAPKLGAAGRRAHRILSLCDGARTVEEIAATLEGTNRPAATLIEEVRALTARYGL